MKNRPKTLILSHLGKSELFSYQYLWAQNFSRNSSWSCQDIDVSKTLSPSFLQRIFKPDIILIMPSVFSNENKLPSAWRFFVQSAKAFTIYIVGNEYKLIPEKMKFCEDMNVNLVLSMLLPESVEKAYQGSFGGALVKPWLFSAVDLDIFSPGPPLDERPIDIGYRSEKGVFYLGHRDRENMAELFESSTKFKEHKKDISMDIKDRFNTGQWADFLKKCKFCPGVESGTGYFDPTDNIRYQINNHLKANPNCTFGELDQMFFKKIQPISGRMASPRHFEAAGTKTVQILYEGRYSDQLKADGHYIPIKKDHSNLEEVCEKMKDKKYLENLLEKSYALVKANHTYQSRVQELEDLVKTLI